MVKPSKPFLIRASLRSLTKPPRYFDAGTLAR